MNVRDDEVESWDVLGKAIRAYKDGDSGPLVRYGMSLMYYVIGAAFFAFLLIYIISV